MSNIRIVASVLIKNEDLYIERVIRNIIDFSDEIIITDHQSMDRTFEVCRALAGEFPKIVLRRIQHLGESAEAIAPYHGTNSWLFAVDGDEIFDPTRLKQMRARLLNGEFSQDWNIFANTLHCERIDLQNKKAWGYLAPPARAGARLFNFSMIEDWQDHGERLLGDKITFKKGYHAGLRRYLHQEQDWENSHFRYVHMSFLPRSSLDKTRLLQTRLNADEVSRIDNQKNLINKMVIAFKVRFAQVMKRDWKNQKYRRGPVVEKDVSVFFP
jgi:cellulose synthase/poly-beta-1,6-N-acetylglucosamine synthase-like glycosyltransferase